MTPLNRLWRLLTGDRRQRVRIPARPPVGLSPAPVDRLGLKRRLLK